MQYTDSDWITYQVACAGSEMRNDGIIVFYVLDQVRVGPLARRRWWQFWRSSIPRASYVRMRTVKAYKRGLSKPLYDERTDAEIELNPAYDVIFERTNQLFMNAAQQLVAKHTNLRDTE